MPRAGRQVHPDVVDEHPEEVIIGIDAADHAARYLLHTVGEKQVVARLYQRVDLLRIELRPVGTAFGPRHAARGLLVDGRMLDDLHRRLLDRHHGRLGHAVDGGNAQRELGLRGLRHSTDAPKTRAQRHRIRSAARPAGAKPPPGRGLAVREGFALRHPAATGRTGRGRRIPSGDTSRNSWSIEL